MLVYVLKFAGGCDESLTVLHVYATFEGGVKGAIGVIRNITEDIFESDLEYYRWYLQHHRHVKIGDIRYSITEHNVIE